MYRMTAAALADHLQRRSTWTSAQARACRHHTRHIFTQAPLPPPAHSLTTYSGAQLGRAHKHGHADTTRGISSRKRHYLPPRTRSPLTAALNLDERTSTGMPTPHAAYLHASATPSPRALADHLQRR